jgi:glycosyltransferase involved in cell wall biosynthesis
MAKPSGIKRRVVLVGPGRTTRGGIAQFNLELARTVTAEGAVATLIDYQRIYPVFSRAGRQGIDPSRRQEQIQSERILVPWLPWTWIRGAASLQNAAPEVIVFQWWHPITALPSWYMARRAGKVGVRVIFICHNAWPHERFPFARALTRLALKNASKLIALSEGVAAELRNLLPRHEVDIIPHPAYKVLSSDATLANRVAAWRAEIASPPNSAIVLFFGNVRPYKGLEDLVHAFARATAQIPATLVVAGTFFQSIDRYRRLIDDLGLRDSVRLVGRYVPNEDVAALFTLSDLIVLPYRSASQSGVVPIAAMFNKPVVATNVGGLVEALAGTGLLVPPSDPGALADAIVRALRNPPSPPPLDPDNWNLWRRAVLP